MSIPTFPESPAITRDNAVNQILSSIALEELGLSHILNAEGEKIQYVVGTIPGVPGPDATVEDVIKVNKSVVDTLKAASNNQMFLNSKMNTALNSSVLVGPTGPAGPPGPTGNSLPLRSLQMMLVGQPGETITANISFDHPVFDNTEGAVTYNISTSDFTLQGPSIYLITWQIAVIRSISTIGTNAASSILILNGTPYSSVNIGVNSGAQSISGSAIVQLPNTNNIISLIFTENITMQLTNANPQANITFTKIG